MPAEEMRPPNPLSPAGAIPAHDEASRRAMLKHLIQQLQLGALPAQVEAQLARLLGQVPHALVVEVEQELLAEGMPTTELARLCHLHGRAVSGALPVVSALHTAPAGHPVDQFLRENAALREQVIGLNAAADAIRALPEAASPAPLLLEARTRLNALADVEKHYLRKEHLLFPFLERHGITGPSKVMWAKHDEVRALLRTAHAALAGEADVSRARAVAEETLRPVGQAIAELIMREEQILLPMSLETLDEREWWEVARQSDDYGYCLVAPEAVWRPTWGPPREVEANPGGRIRLPGGSLSQAELEAIVAALPIDTTFVDAEDRVRWFSHGTSRVFSRSRAVIGRKVQFCHPPSSVGTVERILEGFRAGTHDRATFWIELRGKFVHIDYRALRDPGGRYLGCLEVTQDLTEQRALTGQQRLLDWDGAPAGAPAARPAAHGLPLADLAAAAPRATASAAPSSRPSWADPTRIAGRLDARPLLARGEHPVAQVMASLAALAPGAVFELVTPFPPTPLVERAQAVGCLAHSEPGAEGEIRTWFARGG